MVQLNEVGVLVEIEENNTVLPVQIVLLGTIMEAVGDCAQAKPLNRKQVIENSFLNTL